MERSTYASEIERRMKLFGWTPTELARRAGLKSTYVRDLLRGKSKRPETPHIVSIAGALGCTMDDLLVDSDVGDQEFGFTTNFDQLLEERINRTAPIQEMDIRGAAGGGAATDDWEGSGRVVNIWRLPRDLIRGASYSPPDKIKIITVVGDSMADTFRPYDRVMVDTEDRTPSPPGIFVVWDGLGLVVKRVEFVPFSDPPVVRITSDNTRYAPYERTIEEAHIQGRVLGHWQWR